MAVELDEMYRLLLPERTTTFLARHLGSMGLLERKKKYVLFFVFLSQTL
jgi:hypothetical protein